LIRADYKLCYQNITTGEAVSVQSFPQFSAAT
jgi:hypothetical protein